MPPAGVKSRKRARQYEHIKESEQKQGRSSARAKQIAAATVNKQRREAGETKGSRKRTTTKKTTKKTSKTAGSRKSSAKKTSGSRKTTSRKATSRTRKTSPRKKR